MEITGEELDLLSCFSKLSGVEIIDFEKTPYGLVFIVPKQKLGKAIGKNGFIISKIRKALRQNVFIFAHGDDLETFVRNLFTDIAILDIEIREAMGEKAVFLYVSEKDRGLAIGKNGQRIKIAKQLLKRKFNSLISIKVRKVF